MLGPTAAPDYTWSNSIAEVANFGGTTGGTVSLGGNVTATHGLNFTTAGYSITGGAQPNSDRRRHDFDKF